MKIEKIDHIHLGVKEIEKFRDDFIRLLGLEFTPLQEFHEVKQIACISKGPAEFAIVKPAPDNTVLNDFLEEHGEPSLSFCLKVSDFDDIIADFDRRGIRYQIHPETKRFGKEVKILQIHREEAHGVLIELTEY